MAGGVRRRPERSALRIQARSRGQWGAAEGLREDCWGQGHKGAAEWKAGRRDWEAGTWLEAGNRVAGNRGALGRSAEWKKSHWIQEEVTTGKAA